MKVIINVDGGSRGNPGFGAAGFVIKDCAGKTLRAEGKFLGVCTNNHAEFTALLLALKAAKNLRALELQIYADSLLLVKQFLGEYKIKSPNLKDLMAEIRTAARCFQTVNIAHVPREKNKEADKLVNTALDAELKSAVAKMKKEAGISVKKAAPKGEQLELF
ncbi:MAG: ribonuclease HI family protein [Elusimicrobia bacterium]|nr:ribonuclease HI family protein [Elusimicrobiota bacterium]